MARRAADGSCLWACSWRGARPRHRPTPSRCSASTSGARARRRTSIEVIDPLPYTVTFNVTGGDGGARSGGSRTPPRSGPTARRPASGIGGLLSKARGDYRRLLAALYAAGFYGPVHQHQADGQEVADLTLGVEFPPNVPMTIEVERGPALPTSGATDIVNAPPPSPTTWTTTSTPRSRSASRPGERGLLAASSTRPRPCRSSAGASSPTPRRARPTARSSPTTPTTGSTSP